MDDGIDWHGAICVVAIMLGCISGCVGLVGLGAAVAGDPAGWPATNQAVVAVVQPRHLLAQGLVLAHDAALVLCGALALRSRQRYSRLLRLVFHAGIPVVAITQIASLSEHWTLREILSSNSGLAKLLFVVGLAVTWSALKISFFLRANRYLAGAQP